MKHQQQLSYKEMMDQIQQQFTRLKEIEDLTGYRIRVWNFQFNVADLIEGVKRLDIHTLPLDSDRNHHKPSTMDETAMAEWMLKLSQLSSKEIAAACQKVEREAIALNPQKVNFKNQVEDQWLSWLARKEKMIEFLETFAESFNELEQPYQELLYHHYINDKNEIKLMVILDVSMSTIRRRKKTAITKLHELIACAPLRKGAFLLV